MPDSATAVDNRSQTKAARRRSGLIALAGIAIASLGFIMMASGSDWGDYAFIFAGLLIALYGFIALRRARRKQA